MTTAGNAVKGVWLAWCWLLLAEGAPHSKYDDDGHRQGCGDQLADLLALVCQSRGYANVFRPERSSSRRHRRGIVEECCRKSCSHSYLESYCQPASSTEPYNSVPIRKRSDSRERFELEQSKDVSKYSTTEIQVSNILETSSAPTKKERDDNYNIFNLLASPHKQNTKTSREKITPNDTTEDELFRQNDFPVLRHNKSHHHGSRQFRNRKSSTKPRKAKVESGESGQTFQIGVVKPYFSGRSMATYRSSYVDRAVFS